MANDVTAFFERLVAASAEFNAAVVGEVSALDAVYLDLKPEAGRNGQTIRIPYPDVGAFTDQGANDWTFEDQVPPFVDMTLAEHPGKGILIRDFEQTQTSSQLIEQFLDPMRKRAMEYANGRIFAQVTTANFNSYAPIQTANASIGITDAKLAWNILTRNKVPIRDGMGSILYHVDVHANTLTDTNWYQENLVSAVIAKDTRQNVGMGEGNVAFRFRRAYDQQAVTTQVSVPTTSSVTNGSITVTGTGTTFTTAAPAGSWLTFSSDPTRVYQVKSVTSDTVAILTQPYIGTTNASATVTRTAYTGVAMHKYAIALACRPLQMVNSEGVTSRLLNLGGLPVRAQMSYQHLKDGFMLTMDYVMGVKVCRPNFGIVINS